MPTSPTWEETTDAAPSWSDTVDAEKSASDQLMRKYGRGSMDSIPQLPTPGVFGQIGEALKQTGLTAIGQDPGQVAAMRRLRGDTTPATTTLGQAGQALAHAAFPTLPELKKAAGTSALGFIPDMEVKPTDSPIIATGKEAANLLLGIPKFITTPTGVASVATGSAAPKLVASLFTAQALDSLGQQVLQTHKDWDSYTPAQQSKAILDMVGSGEIAIGSGGLAIKRPAVTPKAPPATLTPTAARNAPEDVHGGAPEDLTPEQQAQTAQNNSRAAFEALEKNKPAPVTERAEPSPVPPTAGESETGVAPPVIGKGVAKVPEKQAVKPAAPAQEGARTRESVLDNARQIFPFGEIAKVTPTEDLQSTDVMTALGHANIPVTEALKIISGEKSFPTREQFENGVDAKYWNDATDLIDRTWNHLRTLGLTKEQFGKLMPQAGQFKFGKDYYDTAKALADKASKAGAGEMAALIKSQPKPPLPPRSQRRRRSG